MAQGFGVRAGYRWVKIVVVVFSTWGIINYLLKLPTTSDPLGKTTLGLLSSLLQACTVFILVKDFFTSRKAAPTEARL
jgi:hypothetical protein